MYVRNSAGKTLILSSGKSESVNDISKAYNIDIQDTNGWTALTWSIANGHTMAAKLLIASGANTDVQDNQGWSALIWCIINNHKLLASLIISGGADVNIKVTIEKKIFYIVKFLFYSYLFILFLVGQGKDDSSNVGMSLWL